MGVLTSNRKRANDCFYLNYKTPLSNFVHISKKIKLSNLNQTLNPKSTVERFYKYPDPINPICRQVHAPTRQSTFVGYKGNLENLAPEMGNFVSRKYSYDNEVIDIEEFEVEGRPYYSSSSEMCVTTGTRGFVGYQKEKVEGGVEVEGPAHYLPSSEMCTTGTQRFVSYQKENVEGGVCEKSDLLGRNWKEADGVVEILDGFDSSRCSKSDKEVINIDDDDDDDDDSAKECGSEDSSIEEVAAGSGENNDLLDGFDGKDSNMKEERIGKKLHSPALKPTRDSSFYVPLYKKFLSSAAKISDHLKDVHFQINYYEKCCEIYRLLRPQKKEEQFKEDLITEAFVPLAEEEKDEVYHALSRSNRRRVLVTHENSNIDITVEILQCLRPRQWLNDEVINVYLELLKEREKREPQKFLKCHFFNTFFYKKLINGRGGYNYQSVRRWTSQRKLGYFLFGCDKIFVPIHKETHWCLAVINKKDQKFQYLDSLRGRDTQVLKVLARYFVDEVKDKSGKDIDVSSWKQEFVEDLPEQKNGFDCGVFMIKYTDFYSRDIGLCFNQEHMQYFRLRTAKELLRLKAN